MEETYSGPTGPADGRDGYSNIPPSSVGAESRVFEGLYLLTDEMGKTRPAPKPTAGFNLLRGSGMVVDLGAGLK